MSVVGHQDFWLAGSRFYFQREAQAGLEQPLIDLGVILPVNPTFEIESVELEDSDGGLKRVVDTGVTKISESMDITVSNLNLDNLAYLFLASSPSAFSQSQAEAAVSQYCNAGRLKKIKDSSGVEVFGLDAIAGVYTGTVSTKTLTTIVVATKTLTLSGDQTAVAGLAPGKALIVNKLGLANITNSATYTIVSNTLNGGNTDIVVSETPAANETAITGQVTHENAGTVYKIGVDWSIYSKDRGIIRFITGGAFAADANLTIVYTTSALSGNRLIYPQSLGGVIKGTGFIVWGRGNNAYQSVRQATVTIEPNASNINVDEFSNLVLTVKVISDITATQPAGKLLQFKGSLPTSS